MKETFSVGKQGHFSILFRMRNRLGILSFDTWYVDHITYGGVYKTQVAFDALLDALGVKIERRYFFDNS